MGSEEPKDLLKNVDWKTVGSGGASESAVPVTKKRLPKKIRQVPDYYFLPRRSLPSAIAVYGAICAAGVGAGMLVEVWIKKKIEGTHHFTKRRSTVAISHFLVARMVASFGSWTSLEWHCSRSPVYCQMHSD